MDREFTAEDMEQNRMVAAFGYLAFFVPLIWRPRSRLGRYCANQGLMLLIAIVLARLLFEIFSIVPLIGWLFSIIGGVVALAGVLVGLFCTVQLTTFSRVVEIPYIGAFRLIPEVED